MCNAMEDQQTRHKRVGVDIESLLLVLAPPSTKEAGHRLRSRQVSWI